MIKYSLPFLVLAKLHEHAGKGDHYSISVRDLSKELNTSPPSIRKAINHLVDLKLIRVEKPSGQHRLLHGPSTYYMLTQVEVI